MGSKAITLSNHLRKDKNNLYYNNISSPQILNYDNDCSSTQNMKTSNQIMRSFTTNFLSLSGMD